MTATTAAPIPLPRRDMGGAGGPQPPAGMVPPAPAAGPQTSSPGDATHGADPRRHGAAGHGHRCPGG